MRRNSVTAVHEARYRTFRRSVQAIEIDHVLIFDYSDSKNTNRVNVVVGL